MTIFLVNTVLLLYIEMFLTLRKQFKVNGQNPFCFCYFIESLCTEVSCSNSQRKENKRQDCILAAVLIISSSNNNNCGWSGGAGWYHSVVTVPIIVQSQVTTKSSLLLLILHQDLSSGTCCRYTHHPPAHHLRHLHPHQLPRVTINQEPGTRNQKLVFSKNFQHLLFFFTRGLFHVGEN